MARFVQCASEDDVRAAHSAGVLYWKHDKDASYTKELSADPSHVIELYRIASGRINARWKYGILVEDEEDVGENIS